MDWERARRPEQKAIRRKSILDAARELYRELPYDDISLNRIAKEAGISKPNVYRYFSAREEIFLQIFEEAEDAFLEAMLVELSALQSAAADPVEEIARAWMEVSSTHPTFVSLLPQLADSMERNASVEELIAFKVRNTERLERLIAAHIRVLPRLSPEDCLFFVQAMICQMAGLWPFANPSENVIEARRHPDVRDRSWDFAPLMSRSIVAILRGLLSSK